MKAIKVYERLKKRIVYLRNKFEGIIMKCAKGKCISFILVQHLFIFYLKYSKDIFGLKK